MPPGDRTRVLTLKRLVISSARALHRMILSANGAAFGPPVEILGRSFFVIRIFMTLH
jgi:hypothetical protein